MRVSLSDSETSKSVWVCCCARPRKESVPGKSLNLTKDDTLQKQVEACREKYATLRLNFVIFIFTFNMTSRSEQIHYKFVAND